MALKSDSMAHSFESNAGERGQRYYHPELHAQYPDERDYNVDAWLHKAKHFPEFDSEELETVREELQAIPEVQEYEREPVKIETIENFPNVIIDLSGNEGNEELASALATLAKLSDEIPVLVDRYTDTVRRFHATGSQRFHQEADRYRTMMENIDRSRRVAHDALIGHLHAISRFINLKIPKTAGETFDQTAWEEHIKANWFNIDQMKDRKYIEEWAMRTDIASKAKAIELAIQENLKKKTADAGELPAPAGS